MHIKPKLNLIFGRIKRALTGDIMPNYEVDYARGFEHAVKLFKVAMIKEFGSYVQIEENRAFEIRELKKENEQLRISLSSAKQHNEHLARMVEQEKRVLKLSNTKKKKMLRAIEEMTGQPYDYVKDKFVRLIEGRGSHNV